jgi:hypothetical protein
MRCEQRTRYPGASAFDFSAILNIVISDILGWDEDLRCSFPQGGAFGKIDAFSGAVEEQGRKTLHCHMLIYIKDLSKLIEAIQRSELNEKGDLVGKRNRDNKRILLAYIDNVMSTRLHPSPQDCNISYKHNCGTRGCPPPQPVSNEILRANRHKRGCVEMNGAITYCPKCLLKHNSEDHVLKRLRAICPSISEFPDKSHMIEIFLMRHIYEYAQHIEAADRDNSIFLVQAFYNLHRSVHAKACFKYGLECRFFLPTLPHGKTLIIIHTGAKIWINIMGMREMHHPLSIILKREVTDLNMNTYNVAASVAFASNTNVKLGEIQTVFYCTTYSTKSTQEDDKKSFQRVIETFARRFLKRRLEIEASNEEDGQPE